ncbi:clumping factor B isoform X2 [Rhipicephalus sanguineus]|uniref:clumping factor B isoform X2 n=1 Tax=Rhipicephalus sanguineus TaxID=34632 RepID=UPI0020C29714|nr:clumping factor B isoform X2 [Rhipicephalus sanguineus]
MSPSASLSAAFFIAALSVRTLCQEGYVKGIGGTPVLAEGGGVPEYIRPSLDYETTDFNGVFTRSMRRVLRQVRRRHNYYRRRHEPEPLESDDSVRKDAVDAWYNKIRLYNFNNNHPQYGTGEFAQIVWKETTALGTGIALGNGSTYYLVTVYDPRGNIRGEYFNNVKRPNVEGGGIRPVLPPQQVPAPMPQPIPVPLPAPVPTPLPEPLPATMPAPMPAPMPRPQQTSGQGAVTINREVQNQAGQPLFRLKGCPGNKPIFLKLNLRPS